MERTDGLTLGLVAVELAGLGYALANALRWLPTGTAPGEGPAGEGWFVGLPTLVLLIGGFGCIYLARRAARPAFAWLIGPLAGAFAVAHHYGFDDYCGGYSCRFADEAPTAWRVVFVVAAAGLVAGALTWLRPRTGLRASGVVAILCALTIFFVPFGH